MPDRDYLEHQAFLEDNSGPLERDEQGNLFRVRAPSLDQIRRRAELIQATWSTREEWIRRNCPHLDGRGEMDDPGWTAPEVVSPRDVA